MHKLRIKRRVGGPMASIAEIVAAKSRGPLPDYERMEMALIRIVNAMTLEEAIEIATEALITEIEDGR